VRAPLQKMLASQIRCFATRTATAAKMASSMKKMSIDKVPLKDQRVVRTYRRIGAGWVDGWGTGWGGG